MTPPHLVSLARAAIPVLVVLALAGCGEEAADERAAVAGERAAVAREPSAAGERAAYRVVEGDRGLAVELPAGWQRAGATLTPQLTDPLEVLSVGTFPLRRGGACNHIATNALTDIGPRDAFVTLLERGYDRKSTWPDFPPRPDRFGPGLGGPSEASACASGARFTDHWFGFTDAGRHFHVLVAFGPDAPPAVRDQAWAVLDSLRIDPSIQPDWPSSG